MAERYSTPIDPELLHSEPDSVASRPKRKSSCESDDAHGRPKKRLSAEVWDAKKSIISKLYRDEKRPLKEVMEIMQREHHFNATVKMYKSRIWKWGLDKKLKGDEVLAILIMKNERSLQGKESVFHIRDQPVDLDNIQRYLKRKPKLMDDFAAGRRPSAQTMAEVQCRTPSPPPEPIMPFSPELRSMEQILAMFRDCVDGEFRTGKWQCEFDVSCFGSDGYRSIDLFERVIASFALANRCMSQDWTTLDLFTVLEPSFTMLLKIYMTESPILLLRTPALIWYLDRRHHNNLNLLPLVVSYMCGLCKEFRDANTALARIWLLLENTRFSDYQELSIRIYEMLCPRIERQIGSANYLTHVLYNDYTDCLYEGRRTWTVEMVLRGHLSRAQATGKRHQWLADVAFEHIVIKTALLEEQGRFDEALRLTIDYIRENDLSDEQMALMIHQVGVRYNRLGYTERALPCFKEAFRVAVELDVDERIFLTCSANLENMLAKLGYVKEEKQILQYRLRHLSSFAQTSQEYCQEDALAQMDSTTGHYDLPEFLRAPDPVFGTEPVWLRYPSDLRRSPLLPPPPTSTPAPIMPPTIEPSSGGLGLFRGPAVSSPETRDCVECPYVLTPPLDWGTEYSHSPDPSSIASPGKFHHSPPLDYLQLPETMVDKMSQQRPYS